MNAFDTITVDAFTLKLVQGDVPKIVMGGRLSTLDPGVKLDAPFELFHDAMVSEARKEVEVDCRPLEYINSSGLKVIIKWISRLLKIPENQRYHVRMLLAKDQVWQEKSFSAFVRLLPRNVELVKM